MIAFKNMHLPRASAKLAGSATRMPLRYRAWSLHPPGWRVLKTPSSAAQKRARSIAEPQPSSTLSMTRPAPTSETSAARSDSVKSLTRSPGPISAIESTLTSSACLRAHASTREARSTRRSR